MIGKTINNIEIVREIGQGGMGTVFEGRDLMLERRVAVKVVRPDLGQDPELAERFQKEARSLARLNHPNVTSVFSFFRQDDQFFLVMELVEGEPLDERLRRQGALPWQEAVHLAIAALDGLGHAHEQGIVHRDIKPANLLLAAAGGIKIMDFGIAHILGRSRLTQLGTVVGTIAYMSPEQVTGREPDTRTDLYSLGIVLYEMVTGRVPFQAESDYELMRAQIEKAPEPPRTLVPGLPAWLERSITRALAKKPEERFAMAAEFAADLRQGLEEAEAMSAAPTHEMAALNGAVPPTRMAVPPTRLAAAHDEAVAPTRMAVAPDAESSSWPTPSSRPPWLQPIPLASAILLAVAGIVVILAMLSGTSPEPDKPPPQTAELPPPTAPPVSMPISPPPPLPPPPLPPRPLPPSPPPPPPPTKAVPPPPPVKTTPPPPVSPPPPPPVEPAKAVEPAAEPVSTKPVSTEDTPSDPNEKLLAAGRIAGQLRSDSERLMEHYEEYLDELEDVDESRLTPRDWDLLEQLEVLEETAARLRKACDVAADREGLSNNDGGRFRKLKARTLRVTKISTADRQTVWQRTEEVSRQGQRIAELMQQANADDSIRSMWRRIQSQIAQLDHMRE